MQPHGSRRLQILRLRNREFETSAYKVPAPTASKLQYSQQVEIFGTFHLGLGARNRRTLRARGLDSTAARGPKPKRGLQTQNQFPRCQGAREFRRRCFSEATGDILVRAPRCYGTVGFKLGFKPCFSMLGQRLLCQEGSLSPT